MIRASTARCRGLIDCAAMSDERHDPLTAARVREIRAGCSLRVAGVHGSLVGRTGVASTALWPEGQVRIAGELWKARCEGGCDPGTSVVVRQIEGLTLVVEAA